MTLLNRHHVTLVILIVLFMLPGFAAFILYKHPEWWEVTRTNKGALINPPIAFVALGREPKWQMVYWQPALCDKKCDKQLDRLARMRLALGRHLYEVEQWILLPKAVNLSSLQEKILAEEDIHVYWMDKKALQQWPQLTDTPQLFLVNPNHYLVLAYSVPVKLSDVYHDIKKLVK